MKKERNKMVAFWFFTLWFVSMANVGYCATTTQAKKDEAAKKIEQTGEKIKAKFNDAADSLSKEKVNEKIDQVADYLDKDKIKEKVDEIADYFDRDRIKEVIDYVADNFDRDKIKGMIDLVAEALDRDKIKGSVNQMIGSIDKEQIKEKFESSVNQISSSLQEVTHNLEEEIGRVGNNNNAVNDLLRKYNWNKWISSQASYGPATLSGLKLGGVKKPVVVAKPGEQLEGEVICSFDRQQCSALSLYRVVLGIKDREGQTTVFNHFGLRAGKETDHFTLTAPREKGVYQVGFRVVEAAREGTAIRSWEELNESHADEPAVIGLIIVV